MSDRKDLPTPKSTNFEARVRETLMTYLGRTGDPLDRGVTLRDLLDSGLAKFRPGRTATSVSVGGSSLPIQPAAGQVQETEPDLTPPPVPTGFAASAGLNMLFIEHDGPQYTQGHGHLRTRVYGKIVNQGDPLPVFADAIEIAQFTGTIYSYPSNPSTQWRLWIKWETADGVLSVSPAGGTNGVAATTGKIGNVDLGPLIVEAGNLANGAVSSAKLASDAITAGVFAPGYQPLGIVTDLPPATGYTGPKIVFNLSDSKIYRYNGVDFTTVVQAIDITGEITAGQISDEAITAAKFATGVAPIEVVTSLPTTDNAQGRLAFLTTDSKIYRHNGTNFTAVVDAIDINSRGLDIKDTAGNVVFASDGEIAPTAYVDVNNNNVLISTIAANSLVPSLNYVGAFSTAPTSTALGAAWKQNAVYKNTLNGKSYVLTGTPLAWVEYLADGQLFLLTIESTNGTIFRVGQSTSTSLHARLFKNGAEVTSETPASWFRWRRVSAIPQAPPNDDATWNANYVSGFKSVSVNVDSVFSRATFFCDIIET